LPPDIETWSAELIGGSYGNPRNPDTRPQHAAYIIYTSGSTGRPKAIVQTQATLLNLLLWQEQTPTSGRVAQLTSISFDVSLQEILGALLFGKTLVVLDSQTRLDVDKYPDFIRTHAIADLFLPNVVLENLARVALETDCDLPTLRNIHQAGEALTVTPGLRRFFARHPDCRLHNHYGPAETHVATAATLSSDPEAWQLAPSIGAPIWNTCAYVLDGGLQLTPIGVAGEIYLAGAGLARGYLKRPALTSERFVANPYSSESGARMYRTGDLARWRADGVLEFFGRTDQQVKIRGVRVEPGEIEAALTSLDAVRQAVVVVRDEGAGGKQLVAYLVLAPAAVFDAAALRDALGDTLPGWMIPSAFVVLDAIPLSPNKKIDRASLPSPRDLELRHFEPPSGAVEERVAEAWKSLLEVERISRDDDFFSLGGHSLLGMRLVSRMRQTFNVELSLRDIFAARTLRELGVVIQVLLIASGRSGSVSASEVQEYEELEL
jgi:amino acid adenylation domain-containing protein